MSYKVIDIEGVGEVYASKLNDAGIQTAEEYLEVCKTPTGRKNLGDKTGISCALILKWANHTDLYRVPGIGPQFAELLEAAGVDTVKELRHRNAEALTAKLEAVNEEKNLTRRIPSVKEVAKMIEAAKELPPVMTY